MQLTAQVIDNALATLCTTQPKQLTANFPFPCWPHSKCGQNTRAQRSINTFPFFFALNWGWFAVSDRWLLGLFYQLWSVTRCGCFNIDVVCVCVCVCLLAVSHWQTRESSNTKPISLNLLLMLPSLSWHFVENKYCGWKTMRAYRSCWWATNAILTINGRCRSASARWGRNNGPSPMWKHRPRHARTWTR